VRDHPSRLASQVSTAVAAGRPVADGACGITLIRIRLNSRMRSTSIIEHKYD
jgi:hypothetical protein